jgi:sialate O-acetylesterase
MNTLYSTGQKVTFSIRKSSFTLICFFIVFIAFSPNSFSQELAVSPIFGDHMVLQQQKPIVIWGNAAPNEKITVNFAGQSVSVNTTPQGKWQVNLNSLQASKTGKELSVEGEGRQLILSDVLVGEVWICSGQSNMQRGVSSITEINSLIPFAKNIRSFEVERTVALQEQDNIKGEWTTNQPTSAVAFAFAYFLENIGDVPVGIIHASWGSSSIEAWMARDLRTELPHFDTIMTEFDSDTVLLDSIQHILDKEDGWSRPEDIYLRRQPNILYNAMLHPIIPLACRGILWYQGERNTRYLSGMPEVDPSNWFHRVCGMKEYGEVLKRWTLNLREKWADPTLHVMSVMLPGYGRGTERKKEIDPESPTEQSWSWMRESQLSLLELPYTSVINTIDLGDLEDIHPVDKLPIGQRAALLAAKANLGYKGLAQGPTMSSVKAKNGTLIVHFKDGEGLRTRDGKNPTGFWISDESGKWTIAHATIKQNSVVLSVEEMKNPLYVRYAFSGKPTINLVNKTGLPAFPFRTDNWEE